RHTSQHHPTAGTNGNSPREPATRCCRDRAPGRTRSGQRCRSRAEGGGRPACAVVHPRDLRGNVRGAAAIVPRPDAGAGACHPARVSRVAFRISHSGSTAGNSGVGVAVHLRGISGAADNRHHLQHRIVHGIDHGDRHCSQEWHSAARRRPKLPRRRTLSGGRHDPSWPPPFASHRDDGHGRGRRHVTFGAGAGRRFPDAATAGHRGNRRHYHFHGALADHYSSCSLLLESRNQPCNPIERGEVMKRIFALFFAATLLAAIPAYAQKQYKVVNHVKLGEEGGWDYLYYDKDGQRLFITRGSHVMVVDANTLKVSGDIPDLSGIHGVALAPELGRGFVSNGGDNTVTIFDLKTLKKLDSVKVGERPDAILYDPFTKHVFTFNARSKDSSVVDAASGKVVGTVPLGGKPEFPVSDGKGKVYANIEDMLG